MAQVDCEVLQIGDTEYVLRDKDAVKNSEIANVAKTGSYNDLSDKPTIPTKVSELQNDSGFITSDMDTKNTAGATDTTDKIFLVGAKTQTENPQTYTREDAYISAGGNLHVSGIDIVDGYGTGKIYVDQIEVSEAGSISVETLTNFADGATIKGENIATESQIDSKQDLIPTYMVEYPYDEYSPYIVHISGYSVPNIFYLIFPTGFDGSYREINIIGSNGRVLAHSQLFKNTNGEFAQPINAYSLCLVNYVYDKFITLDISNNSGGAVDSVNGKTGVVVLNASDVGALPDNTHIPTVSVSQTLESGTEIGSVTVDGTETKLYAPNGGGGGEYYVAGDTFSIQYGVAINGLLTTSNKQIILTIPVDKSLANISTITAKNIVGGVRVPTGGYLNINNVYSDSSVWCSNGTLTKGVSSIECTKISNYLVRLSINLSSAAVIGSAKSASTNNVPVAMLLSSAYGEIFEFA